MEGDEEQKWYIFDKKMEGPYSTTELESLWSLRQIDSLSQISQDPEGPRSHIMENIDLMNNFIDLQFQEQALQNANIQQHLSNTNKTKEPQQLPLLPQRQLQLKQMVKTLKTFKAIQEKEGLLDQDDKVFTLKELKKAKKLEKQKQKQKVLKQSSKANTSIYIKGLPDDVSLEELKEFFSKAGVIKSDVETGDSKIKIYRDELGRVKGDALVSYIKSESVELAIQMLNDRILRPDFRLIVEEASFKLQQKEKEGKDAKGVLGIEKTIDKQKTRLNKIKARSEQLRMFSWGDDDNSQQSGLLIVQISNLYSPDEMIDDIEVQTLEQEIKEECEDRLGPVGKVRLFPENPEGIALIKFKSGEHARQCIGLMNKRWFNQRQLICDYYDGVTDHNKFTSTQLDDEKRINQFGDWLEQQ